MTDEQKAPSTPPRRVYCVVLEDCGSHKAGALAAMSAGEAAGYGPKVRPARRHDFGIAGRQPPADFQEAEIVTR